MTHKTAIIGLGIMGRRLLENLLVHPAFEPVALWDPSAGSCDKARAVAPGVPVVDSAEAAIAAADVLYLACPPVPRKAYALAAAGAGKAVFLEKPLGVDIPESRDLVQRLAAAGTPAAVNFTQASSRGFEVLRSAIDGGEAGDVLGIDIVVTYPAWPRAWQVDADWLRFKAEGGYTREVISHFPFLSERFLGPLTLRWAHPSYPADPALCETQVLARLETTDGRPVSVLGSVGGAQPDRQEVTVKASKTGFRFTEFYQLWKSTGGEWSAAYDFPTDPRRDSLQRQLGELDKCVRGEPHRLATPEEALRVQVLIEGMLAGQS
ncbi:MAG: Gfo/Idh/MocA family oxidoreductase [Thalassobaculum sp.]|uniref:Gfo/Idh/MocA family protein n=1 Tax=Thalassobaculum sp. TaxID=2022740 RepID=UPI0032EF614B